MNLAHVKLKINYGQREISQHDNRTEKRKKVLRTNIIKIALVAFIALSSGCKGKAQNKEKELIWLDDINSESILKNTECKEKIIPSEVENIDTFITELKSNFNNGFDKIILMFYIEGGEIIEFYSVAVLVNEEGAELALYKDGIKNTKTLPAFDINRFYTYLSIIEEEEIVVKRKLLVIDVGKEDVKCSSYKNIKKEKGQQIKELTFLKD